MVAVPSFLLHSAGVLSILNPLSAIHDSFTRHSTTAQSTALQYTIPNDPYKSVDGPVITSNFPDPTAILVNDTYYSFATNNRKALPDLIHIPVSVSTDYKTWKLLPDHDALPDVGPWAKEQGIWAPSVVQLVCHLCH